MAARPATPVVCPLLQTGRSCSRFLFLDLPRCGKESARSMHPTRTCATPVCVGLCGDPHCGKRAAATVYGCVCFPRRAFLQAMLLLVVPEEPAWGCIRKQPPVATEKTHEKKYCAGSRRYTRRASALSFLHPVLLMHRMWLHRQCHSRVAARWTLVLRHFQGCLAHHCHL